MTNGKVLKLYMTMPDMMRSGHRQRVEDFECNPGGIVGDKNYEDPDAAPILLVSEKSYEIIEEAELFLDQGVLMENIYVDIDLNHLKQGTIIEIGETLFEVNGPCQAYNYLYAFSPELPELLDGKRGIFITPVEHGRVALGDEVKVVQEA